MNYIISIPMWMLIFILMAKCFGPSYIAGGWIDPSIHMSEQQSFVIVFCVCAIPLLRLFISCMLLIAAFYPKQIVEDKLKELLEDIE